MLIMITMMMSVMSGDDGSNKISNKGGRALLGREPLADSHRPVISVGPSRDRCGIVRGVIFAPRSTAVQALELPQFERGSHGYLPVREGSSATRDRAQAQVLFICSPPDRRRQRAAIASVSQFPARELPTSDRMVRTTTEALDREGILGTWQAAACLALAELIDAGKHGASGAAGTIRAHRDAVNYAIQSVGNDEADVIELIFSEK